MSWLSSTLARLFGAVPAEEREGIEFRGSSWEVSPGKAQDLSVLFQALGDLVPDDSVLYLEGTSIAADIQSYLRDRAPAAAVKVAMGTIWPRPQCLHMEITPDNLNGLAQLAERHVGPEIADHLHVYQGEKIFLEWYDAFFDPLRISTAIPEDRVRAFCARLGVGYQASP